MTEDGPKITYGTQDEVNATLDQIKDDAEKGFAETLRKLATRQPFYLAGERYVGDLVAPVRMVYSTVDHVWRMRCIGILPGAVACTDQWDLVPGTGLSDLHRRMQEMVAHLMDVHNVR